MTVDRVYVILAEVRPLQGCQLNPTEVAGAWVRCYVPAESEERACARLKAALSEDRLALVQTKWVVDDAQTHWEREGDPRGEQLVADARSSGEVTYGEFHVWSPDAPDAEDPNR